MKIRIILSNGVQVPPADLSFIPVDASLMDMREALSRVEGATADFVCADPACRRAFIALCRSLGHNVTITQYEDPI